MRITTVLENSAGRKGLTNQHGLSLLIQTTGRTILFDAGPGDAISSNAKALGIRLSDVDIAILSHGHYDHSGGLESFFQENMTAKLYAREGVDGDHYAKWGDSMAYIGIDKALFQRERERIIVVNEDIEIGEGIYLLVSIPCIEPRPIGNDLLFTKENEAIVRDSFDHELVLVIKEEDGIVIFTGCGHSGVLNMVHAAKRKFPDQRIKAVIGGFHLSFGVPSEDIARNASDASTVADGLVELGCERVISGHCTGDQAIAALTERLRDRHDALFTGFTVDV
jgi:7,8-dihydropterin-6-yl-methyl-4-(beta-D-ribofuranosyl)aminobenzene 5'-phosphate synthase